MKLKAPGKKGFNHPGPACGYSFQRMDSVKRIVFNAETKFPA
jgi:hypothetical protein